ncbi:MAG: TetM/TetW/TetO/TetS family tetracycline resistance ribosomal protection protein [Clostridia bacterium]|nr:TetM/TetW/TetO/TetS family tetracycline resistance ribosomal protection protein [Clostridia bacterium]
MKKKLTIGILAHVDAGKTTLSEALLYLSGRIRTLGRVDHKNTYLDTHAIERERGITVFSKQARFSTELCDFILLDTPGHVDFSAEAERVLALLDYAILVISGTDGVQNHTRTLWQLLAYYSVPTLIFVNKTDIAIKLKQEMADEFTRTLDPRICAFYEDEDKSVLDERLALLHEDFLDSFLAGEPIANEDIAALVAQRRLFPCLFGSALRMQGVDFLLEVLDRYTLSPVYNDHGFGAKVYKIARTGNTRLTYIKLTGGTLTARDEVVYLSADGKRYTEKVSQLRLYSGDKFEQVDSVGAGEICAVLGLSATYIGQGLGMEADTCKPVLEPVLSYRINLPPECDVAVYFPKLKEFEEEEPSLHLFWNEELRQIEARLMGEVQIELLVRLISERFGVECTLDTGRILYKEKIAAKAIGVGHFEPLRHYAEVQLLMEPQPKGTGLIFDSRVSENNLDLNWQRLILYNLYEKTHRGTSIGAALTDTKITLVAGKAHLKHTEGGDFREATLRAVRHGLMKAGCILLEPYYKFRLEIPNGMTGRAMSDLQARSAEFEVESSSEEITTITGRGPVATLHDYTREVIAYTRGNGRLFCTSDGYESCHNADEIVAKAGYDPESDLENTPHSVFCAHGAGIVVPWQEVDAHKHLDAGISLSQSTVAPIPKVKSIAKKYELSDEDLEAIMLREFGPIRRKKYTEPKITVANGKAPKRAKAIKAPKNLLIVDGYNVIYSADALQEIANYSLEKARETLMDVMSNYHAFTKTDVLLVFDAYLVKDSAGSEILHDDYRVVYTRQDQTADAYIEQIMHDLGPDYSIRVVTGDRLLQFSAVSYGISRMTAKEFWDEITQVGNEINDFVRKLAAKQS